MEKPNNNNYEPPIKSLIEKASSVSGIQSERGVKTASLAVFHKYTKDLAKQDTVPVFKVDANGHLHEKKANEDKELREIYERLSAEENLKNKQRRDSLKLEYTTEEKRKIQEQSYQIGQIFRLYSEKDNEDSYAIDSLFLPPGSYKDFDPRFEEFREGEITITQKLGSPTIVCKIDPGTLLQFALMEPKENINTEPRKNLYMKAIVYFTPGEDGNLSGPDVAYIDHGYPAINEKTLVLDCRFLGEYVLSGKANGPETAGTVDLIYRSLQVFLEKKKLQRPEKRTR